MAKKGMHAFVTGRVQGVWFRQSTVEQASRSDLTGWVRNLPDGRVEVMAYGEENAIRQLEAWLNKGPLLANVADVSSEMIDYEEEHSGFLILG